MSPIDRALMRGSLLGKAPHGRLDLVVVERIRKRYPESISKQPHVPPVGLIGFVRRLPRLINSPHRLFFRRQASYLSTVDESSA